MGEPRAPVGYVLLAELGRGGFGAVWRARAPDGSEVALKLLDPAVCRDPTDRARFAAEVQALLRVSAPGLARLRDAGDGPDGPYLAMELVPGRTLADRLSALGPLDPRQVVTLALHLIETLEALHAQGVVHRDIKPANVMLREDGRPVLLDLGLALLLDRSRRLTHTGELLGTPAWMAPEQAQGDPRQVGPACDVYGLGALMWGLLVGRPIHQGPVLKVLEQLLTQDPPPPSRGRAGLDPRLDELILACLRRDPQRRPSLAEVQRRLLALRAPGGRPRRGRRLAAALGLLLLSGAVGWAWTRWRANALAAQVARGAACLERKQLAEAREAFERATREDPRCADAWDGLGLTCLTLEDLPGARAALERALALAPDSASAWEHQAMLHALEGSAAQMLAALERAIALGPPRAELYYQRALARSGETQVDQHLVLNDLDRALALQPDHGGALAMRASTRMHLDLPGWELDLERAFSAPAPSPLAYVSRAYARERDGDQTGALGDMDEAIRRGPDLPVLWLARARKRARFNDRAGAAADLRQALARLPSGSASREAIEAELRALEASPEAPPSSFATLAERMEAGAVTPAEVRREMDLRLGREPGQRDALLLRGMALNRLGEFQAARRDLTELVERFPRDPRMRFLRAQASDGLGELPLALNDLDQALALAPDLVSALLLRGDIHLRAQREQAALTDFQAASARDPRRLIAWQGQSRALVRLGRREEAVTALDQVLELKPNDTVALASRGLLRLELGRFEEGVTDLEQAVAREPQLARDPGLIGRLTGLLPTLPPELADRGRALLSRGR